MTPLHHAIKGVLLPVLLENTKLNREREAVRKEPAKVDEKVARVHALFKKEADEGNISTDYMRHFSKVLVAFTGDQSFAWNYENRKDRIEILPLSVVVAIANSNGHNVPIGTPVIIIHGREWKYLAKDGGTEWVFMQHGKDTRHATDEEVEACIDGLDSNQLCRIFTTEYFRPVIEPLFAATEELVAVEDEDNDDE